MKVELTKAEGDLLVQLLDAAVRAVGLQAVKGELVSVIAKLQDAAKAAEYEQKDGP